MIADDEHHLLQKLIAEITLNITLHRSKCNKLLRHFLP